MSDSKKKNVSGISSVDSAKRTEEVEKATHVSEVSGVQKTSSVGRVSGIETVEGRKATRIMTFAEREQIFKMINEEADKIFPHSSDEKKKMLTEAVKMAIDSSLLDEENPEK